jgi:type I restriction enzyme S subunit
MSNWQSVKLGELLHSLKTGLNPRNNFKLNTLDADNWYITVRELNGFGVNFLPQTDKVNNHALKLINNRSNLEVGDILFSGTGTIGKIAIINKHPANWNIKEGVYTLKPKKDRLESYYLMYLLKHLNQLNVFNKISAGSTVFSVPMKSLEDLNIQIHKLPEQIKISNVLKTLDSKIELNNQINAELEKMAKTLYDYWFVQFDFPDCNGKPYKSAGGKMIWNEELKREIPEGWEVLQLSNKLTFEKGIEPGSAQYKEKRESINHIRFIRVGDIENYSSIFVDNSQKKYATVNEKDVLVTFDGSVGKVAFGFEGAYSGGLRKIYDKSRLIDSSLIYFIFKDERLIKIIHQYATGSILLHAGASINNLKISFNEKKYLEFQNIIKPFFYKMIINKKQNQTLANLRDWLLPMLMNGQVKVE